MSPFSRVGVVFNGAKSRRRLARYCGRAKARADAPGAGFAVYSSTSPADLDVQARRAVADGNDLIVAAGGDGTLLAVLQAVRGTAVVVSVLPLGTCNDTARALGIRNEADALRALDGGVVRRIDLGICRYLGVDGKVRETVFSSSAGLGFTAALVRCQTSALASALKRVFGSHAFALLSVLVAARFHAVRAAVTLDGRRLETPITLLEVSKVARLAGLPLTPRADLESNSLDVCVFDGGLLRRFQLLLSLVRSDPHIRWRDFEYFCDRPALNSLALARVTDVEVLPQEPMALHIQGELVGCGSARFGVLGSALPALVSAR